MITAKEYMKKNPPRKKTTAKERFEISIKGELEKDIVDFLKGGYSVREINDFLSQNEIKVSSMTLNNYLKEVADKKGIVRQPEQLKK